MRSLLQNYLPYIKKAIIAIFVAFSALMCINFFVHQKGAARILGGNPTQTREYAIVLGASVTGGKLSDALKSRMNQTLYLYERNLVEKILITGDGTTSYYNETQAMEHFARSRGVPSQAIVIDPEGYSTYASIFRAKNVFEVKSAYILSQEFHLSRALYLANDIGIDAQGVPSGGVEEEFYYSMREIPARIKDFLLLKFRVAPRTERDGLL